MRIRRPQFRRGRATAAAPRTPASVASLASHSSLWAVAVLTAATVTPIAVVGVQTVADNAPAAAVAPAETGVQEVPLADAPNAQGVPQDIADGDAVVKEITSQTPFSMVGVTWSGNDDGSAQIRAKQPDGSWGQWFAADSVADDLDADQQLGRTGTEPVFLGTQTTAVQIALRGVNVAESAVGNAPDAMTPASATPAADAAGGSGDATDLGNAIADALGPDMDTADTYGDVNKPVVEDRGQIGTVSADEPTTVDAVLLSPDLTTPAAADGAATQLGQYGDVAMPAMPTIISRKGWGANEGLRCKTPYYNDHLLAATVHHTAGSNNYTKDESAGIVRGIYTYHAKNLGWCDIGYNVLVDKYGQAFEGRYGGLDKYVQGAHAGGFNGNTFGISMMGNYSDITPPPATLEKVGQIIGWKLAISGVDPLGEAVHVSEGTQFTKYPKGTRVTLPNIFAHRDVGNTECPGDAGYAQMDNIRRIAAQYAKTSSSTAQPTKPNTPKPTTTTQAPSTGPTTRPNAGGDNDSDSDPAPDTGTGRGNSGGTGSLESMVNRTTGSGSTNRVLANVDKDELAQEISELLMRGAGMNLDGLQALGAVNKLGSIMTTAQALLDESSNDTFAQVWRALGATAGPLGKALSGVQTFKDVSYAKFEHGAIYSSERTGAHPVWGKIGDAWAAQGFEHGELGLPVAAEERRPDGTFAQDFEHGTLVFDPASQTVHVEGPR